MSWEQVTKEELRKDEALMLHAYPDPISPMGRRLGRAGIFKCGTTGYLPPEERSRLEEGKPFTIGYGHAKPWVKYGAQITKERAEILLDNDLQAAVSDARFLVGPVVWNGLAPARKSVLANMAFNLGRERLGGFKNMLNAVREGRFNDAALEMINSRWYQQVRSRASRLADRMRAGVFS